jgi:hypothetical protein
MRYRTLHQLTYVGDLAGFDEWTDRLYEALLDLADIENQDLTATLSTGEVDIVMIVEANDFIDAVRTSICDLRTTLHAIGCGTQGWDSLIRELSHSASLLQDA